MASDYDECVFKIPIESEDYMECSDFVVDSIECIMQTAMDEGRNEIIINTNLKLGLPMENITKRPPTKDWWISKVRTESH